MKLELLGFAVWKQQKYKSSFYTENPVSEHSQDQFRHSTVQHPHLDEWQEFAVMQKFICQGRGIISAVSSSSLKSEHW